MRSNGFWPTRSPALLDAMWDVPDFYFDTICQVHVDHWWRGRVALVGEISGRCAPTWPSGRGGVRRQFGHAMLLGVKGTWVDVYVHDPITMTYVNEAAAVAMVQGIQVVANPGDASTWTASPVR